MPNPNPLHHALRVATARADRLRSQSGIHGTWIIEKRDGRLYNGPRNPDGSVPYEAALKLPVYQRVVADNKMLLRGLGYLMHACYSTHPGTFTPPSVSDSPTTNPFGAVIFTRSQIRPDWFESNTSNNSNSTPGAGETGTGTPNFGTRGVDVNDNTGTLRMTTNAHLGTGSTDTIEMVIYAQDNPGGAVETGDKGIDNFDIRCIGMAQGTDAGDGGTESRWGIRSVLGQKPQIQGVTDRVSVGEPAVGGGSDPLPANASTLVNSYVASNQGSEPGGFEGHNAFDGDSSSEYDASTPGSWLGGTWRSAAGTAHYIGRVWTVAKAVSGFRLIIPQGIALANVPDLFRAERLTGADPLNPAHWTAEAEHDYTATTQSAAIFSAGPYGVEYMFSSPLASSNGFRIASITAQTSGLAVDVAELMIFTEMAAKTLDGTQNQLSLSTDGGSNYRDFTTGSVASTVDVQDLVDAINGGTSNNGVLGYEIEARRTDFGFLVVQGTTQGLNSLLDLQSVANTAHTELGLATGAYTGTNTTITKGQNDIVTFTYRITIGLNEGTNA